MISRGPDRALEIAVELADVRSRLAARTGRRALPLLDGLRVAKPCDQDWNEMLIEADPRVRHCLKCVKPVYDISTMTREDAEMFLQAQVESPCVRLYQRADGTIVTRENCSVGASTRRLRRALFAVAAAGTTALCAVAFAKPATTANFAPGVHKRAPLVDMRPPSVPSEYPTFEPRLRVTGGAPPPLREERAENHKGKKR